MAWLLLGLATATAAAAPWLRTMLLKAYKGKETKHPHSYVTKALKKRI